MTCPFSKPSTSKFVIIATKDGITFNYKHAKALWEAAQYAKEFKAEGFMDIKVEWQNESFKTRKVYTFCHECNMFHVSQHSS